MHQVVSGAEKLGQLKQAAEHINREEIPLSITVKHDPLKRAFDIAFSFSIILLLSPLFLFLSFLVRLTSPGPVFYKSRRLGRGGGIIDCWKFRTMYKDAEIRLYQLLQSDKSFRDEWEAFQKVQLDPRITPIGRFLRRTSLDEIPQFWNVLKGDLSVVGPRPPTLLGQPEQYLKEIRVLYGDSAEKILSVRPGITGVWQISGRSKITFDERRKMEERYAENRTFWEDLAIVAKTVPAVLFSRGAF